MAEVLKPLYVNQPATGGVSIYTPPGLSAVIKQMTGVNMGSVSATIGLGIDSAAAAKRIMPDVTLAPGEFFEWDGTRFLLGGGTPNQLFAICSVASTITLAVFGVELS